LSWYYRTRRKTIDNNRFFFNWLKELRMKNQRELFFGYLIKEITSCKSIFLWLFIISRICTCLSKASKLIFIKKYSSFHLTKKNVGFKIILILRILLERLVSLFFLWMILWKWLLIKAFIWLALWAMVLLCNFNNSLHIAFFFYYSSMTLLRMLFLLSKKAR